MNTEDYTFYNNTGYRNTRNRKQILILDVDDSATGATHLGSAGEFNVPLLEPLIIDKQSEVYLDNFVTFNSNITNDSGNSAFVLKINEFNIHSGVASNSSSDKIDGGIVIPNDNNNIDNYFGTVVHKGKKFNYICDINPCKLHSISGKITDLNGDPIFHGPSTGTKFTYALTGIDTWGSAGVGTTARALIAGDILSSIAPAGGTATAASTRILANTALHGSSIFFTAEEELTQSEFDAVDIVFTVTSSGGFGAYTFIISTATNPGVVLLKQNGRFISEFSIVSRD